MANDPAPSKTIINSSGQRISVSSTGAAKEVKLARFDLIPVNPLTQLAELYGRGAEKYAAHNWAGGYEWSKSYAAAMRHITQFWGGEDYDSETGAPHLASAIFHCMSIIEFMGTHPEFDDRPISGKGADLAKD